MISIKPLQGYFLEKINIIKNNSNDLIKKAPESEQIKLIAGGDEMKYRGITIIKRKDCNTWCARYRRNGKQFYISAKTQQDCYN